MKDPVKVNRGRNARLQGHDFEDRVRIDLEDTGWTVDKWSNNLFTLGNAPFSIGCKLKIDAAKHKKGKDGRPLELGTGFPDFIAFRTSNTFGPHKYCEVIGVESKMNGILSAIEKEKCRWYLKNGTFSKILIARKEKEGRKVVVKYADFEEKYGR